MFKRSQLGFTLIELLIAVVIIIIIAVVAVANYTPYLLKGRRSDGISSLLSVSLAEERYRTDNSTYGTLAQAYGGVNTSHQGYYTLSVSNVSGSTYTVTATAIGNQANDSEDGVACGTLTLAVDSGTITKTPAACWPN